MQRGTCSQPLRHEHIRSDGPPSSSPPRHLSAHLRGRLLTYLPQQESGQRSRRVGTSQGEATAKLARCVAQPELSQRGGRPSWWHYPRVHQAVEPLCIVFVLIADPADGQPRTAECRFGADSDKTAKSQATLRRRRRAGSTKRYRGKQQGRAMLTPTIMQMRAFIFNRRASGGSEIEWKSHRRPPHMLANRCQHVGAPKDRRNSGGRQPFKCDHAEWWRSTNK